MKPPKLGSIVPDCKIQIINESTMKWKTLAVVTDTPRHINEAVKELSGKYRNLWVKHCYGRKPLF